MIAHSKTCQQAIGLQASWLRNENDADRGGGFGEFEGRGQCAGGGIDVEDDDVVGLLISGEEKFAGGVDGEGARSFSHGWIFVSQFQSAFRGIDREGAYGVDASAVGGVEKFSVRMHGDFRGFLRT